LEKSNQRSFTLISSQLPSRCITASWEDNFPGVRRSDHRVGEPRIASSRSNDEDHLPPWRHRKPHRLRENSRHIHQLADFINA
jgi:hypothetical protein